MSLNQPSPEQQVLIRETLKENVNTRDRDLEAIKEWLRKQPHLPDTWDEVLLMNFLRGCKFSMEKTKNKLDTHFTMRAAYPEFFTDRDIKRPEIQEILSLLQVGVMPQLTPEGARLIVGRATTVDFDYADNTNVARVISMFSDILYKIEEEAVAGEVIVVDASVALFKHFVKVSPIMLKKFSTCMQEGYPIRIKGVHVVNPTPFVAFLLKWVTPFIKDKIMKRVRVHQDLESLHEYVPKELLPEEFGGTAGKLQKYMEEWMKTLEEHGDWLKEQEIVKADESKRPGTPRCQEFLGTDGSFRELEID